MSRGPPGPQHPGHQRELRTNVATMTTEETPRVDFWFDPVSPYTWITYRWLLEVERQRPLDLRLHLMSLYLHNEGRQLPDWQRRAVDQSLRVARVAAAATEAKGEEILRELYTALGKCFHFPGYVRGQDRDYDGAITTALAETGLPASLAAAADDPSWDEAVRRSHEAALLPGTEGHVGTPTLHVDGAVWFGPVLRATPRGPAAVELFDSFRVLARHPDLFELKRTRTGALRFD